MESSGYLKHTQTTGNYVSKMAFASQSHHHHNHLLQLRFSG